MAIEAVSFENPPLPKVNVPPDWFKVIPEFKSPAGVVPVTVCPVYFVSLGLTPSKSMLILSFLYLSGIPLDPAFANPSLPKNLNWNLWVESSIFKSKSVGSNLSNFPPTGIKSLTTKDWVPPKVASVIWTEENT